ncbi:MAG: sulfurtransferase-like selenium metabolism protein YedF [Actinobacteria bacterium]|nr:sulfurtransferase-like selenium metabolism protein YedF [Actinomycetota bacterium]
MKVVFVNSERIGEGDDELGARLMGSFLYSLARTDRKPDVLVLMNGGVRLACKDSKVLDDIRLVLADGVKVYSCGTCLDFFGLKDDLAVGEVGNMNDTVAMLMDAEDVVSIG